MKMVSVTEAKAKLADLVYAVEAGDEIVLTRHGKRVAYLSSQARQVSKRSPAEIDEILEDARRLHASQEPVAMDEIIEISNLVLMNMRCGRIDSAGVGKVRDFVQTIPTRLLDVGPDDRVFRLAQTRDLTIYDASYLQLAISQKLPLATYDKALHRAAVSAGVEILG